MSQIPDKLSVKEASDLAEKTTIERLKAERVPEGDPVRLVASVPWWERVVLFLRTNVRPLVVLVGRYFGLDLSSLFVESIIVRGPVIMDIKKLSVGLLGVVLVAVGGYMQLDDTITLAEVLPVVGAAILGWLKKAPWSNS